MFENIQEIINELHRMKKEYNAPQGCCVRTQERNGYRSKCLSIAIKALSEVQTLAQAKAEGRLVVLPETGIGDLSDGYHTFNELYHHRAVLFSVICNQNKDKAWKSKLHADGTMFDGYFIVGIDTPKGTYTYHYQMKYWDLFDVKELERAPEWDGHKPEDVDRLLSLAEKALGAME
jgi:hypothetical protein